MIDTPNDQLSDFQQTVESIMVGLKIQINNAPL